MRESRGPLPGSGLCLRFPALGNSMRSMRGTMKRYGLEKQSKTDGGVCVPPSPFSQLGRLAGGQGRLVPQQLLMPPTITIAGQTLTPV